MKTRPRIYLFNIGSVVSIVAGEELPLNIIEEDVLNVGCILGTTVNSSHLQILIAGTYCVEMGFLSGLTNSVALQVNGIPTNISIGNIQNREWGEISCFMQFNQNDIITMVTLTNTTAAIVEDCITAYLVLFKIQ